MEESAATRPSLHFAGTITTTGALPGGRFLLIVSPKVHMQWLPLSWIYMLVQAATVARYRCVHIRLCLSAKMLPVPVARILVKWPQLVPCAFAAPGFVGRLFSAFSSFSLLSSVGSTCFLWSGCCSATDLQHLIPCLLAAATSLPVAPFSVRLQDKRPQSGLWKRRPQLAVQKIISCRLRSTSSPARMQSLLSKAKMWLRRVGRTG